jgi:hypothetical protein
LSPAPAETESSANPSFTPHDTLKEWFEGILGATSGGVINRTTAKNEKLRMAESTK